MATKKSGSAKQDQARTEQAEPDQQVLTTIGAQRLATLTRAVEPESLAGVSIAEILEKHRWKFEPELLAFRRICGQVVKKDPVTGVEHPVPFATVHVEDTDCGLLGYYPFGWPWGWFLPLFCRREELATVQTDECGRFCVFIPRFDIDWILRWRRIRICYPIIFLRPRLVDLLERLPEPFEEWPPKRPPIPDPDPPPVLLKNGGLELRRAAELVGRKAATALAAQETSVAAGDIATSSQSLLSQPLDPIAMPAPLPPDIDGDEGRPKSLEGVFSQIQRLEGEDLKLAERALAEFDLRRFIGPFWRCRDIVFPQWLPIFDVPDVTFRVTQDVDGDGDEEVIYSEGFLDVRWNTGSIPDVKLEASQIAVAGVSCDNPPVPCGNEPAIVTAGLMPLHNLPSPAEPYHDNGTGYAQRPNRPHASARPSAPGPHGPATAPFTNTLQLYGCAHGLGGQFYRLRYAFAGAGMVPFLNLAWNLVRLGSGGLLEVRNVVPDADGWYEVIDPADGWLPSQLLLNWPTGQNGRYEIELQLGDASRSVVNTSDTVGIRVDNSNPIARFTALDWRPGSSGAWNPLELVCPVVFRPPNQTIQFRVTYEGSAEHLRDMSLTAGGCGAAAPQRLAAPGWSDPGTPDTVGGVWQSPYEHWHTGPSDNAVSRRAIFSLAPAPTAPQGAYSFHLGVMSRAFNPSGGDGGFEADWNYNPVVRWTSAFLPIAVVDA